MKARTWTAEQKREASEKMKKKWKDGVFKNKDRNKKKKRKTSSPLKTKRQKLSSLTLGDVLEQVVRKIVRQELAGIRLMPGE